MLIECASHEFLQTFKKISGSDLKTYNDLQSNILNSQLIDVSYVENSLQSGNLKFINIPFDSIFVKDRQSSEKLPIPLEIFISCGIDNINSQIYEYIMGFFILDNDSIPLNLRKILFMAKIENSSIKLVRDTGGITRDRDFLGLKSLLEEYIENALLKLNSISPQKTICYKTKPAKIRVQKTPKKHTNIEKPIYIYVNKNNTEQLKIKAEYSKTYGTIEHLKSWAVRGHWRQLDNVWKRGKNAQGEYVVEGYTWVKPCIKGNKDMHISKKTYIAVS